MSHRLLRLAVKWWAPDLVRDAYAALLDRDPDPEGLEAYTDELRRTGRVADLLRNLAGSQEAWELQFAAHSEELARHLYRGLLGREPSDAEVAACAERLPHPRNLMGELAGIAASEEAWRLRFPAHSKELARQLYRGLLNREPSDAEVAACAERLPHPRSLIEELAGIAASEEAWRLRFPAHSKELARQLYRGLLNREPGDAEVAACAERLEHPQHLTQELAGMANSEEAWQLRFAAHRADLARQLYRALLNREPNEAEVAACAGRLPHSQHLTQELTGIAGSDEAWQLRFAAHSNELARQLYRALLNREPTDAETAARAQRLQHPQHLAQEMAAIADSEEAWQLRFAAHTADLARQLYRGLLNREPSDAEVSSCAGRLSHSQHLTQELAGMAGSEEAWRLRFAAHTADLARQMYRGLLNREPSDSELAACEDRLRNPLNLASALGFIIGSLENFNQLILQRSPDLLHLVYRGFTGAEPDDEVLRQRLTNRIGDSSALLQTLSLVGSSPAFISKLLDRHSSELDRSRAPQLERSMVRSTAPHLVEVAFRGILGRDPEPQAASAYARKIRDLGDLTGMLGDIANSQEFKVKIGAPVGTLVNPAQFYDVPTWVFLHIQKTAGTSLQSMIRAAFPDHKIYTATSDRLHLHCPAELAGYTVFGGHFNHDSLGYIPRSRLAIFTFVRDPKKRLLSLYYHWRSHEPSHDQYAHGPNWANALCLAEFFGREDIVRRFGLWNHMTWAIMGERTWRKWRGRLTGSSSSQASDFLSREVRPAVRRRLREFLFVGIHEDFDRSVALLFKCLERAQPVVPQLNVTDKLGGERHFKVHMDKETVTEETVRILNGLTEIDGVIYQEAESLLARRWPARTGGPRAARLRSIGA